MTSYMNVEQQIAHNKAMAFAAYLSDVRTARIVHPEQREGQAHFNTLYLMNPDLADEVRGSNVDPFYNDDRLPAFRDFVRDRLI